MSNPVNLFLYCIIFLGFISGLRYIRTFLEPIDYFIIIGTIFAIPIIIKMLRWAWLTPIVESKIPITDSDEENEKIPLLNRDLENEILHGIITEMQEFGMKFLIEEDFKKIGNNISVPTQYISEIVKEKFHKFKIEGIEKYTPYPIEKVKKTAENRGLGDNIGDNIGVGEDIYL